MLYTQDHRALLLVFQPMDVAGKDSTFNRSYYEEVLVTKVHEERLAARKMHPSLVTGKIWEQRYEDIRSYGRYLARNSLKTVKFFLQVSKAEQQRRFMARLDCPEKNWKFSASDVA